MTLIEAWLEAKNQQEIWVPTDKFSGVKVDKTITGADFWDFVRTEVSSKLLLNRSWVIKQQKVVIVGTHYEDVSVCRMTVSFPREIPPTAKIYAEFEE